MKADLSVTLATAGLRALARTLRLVVVGSVPAACGDDNQLPFAIVDTLPNTEIMTEKSRQEYYVDDYFRDPDGDPLAFTVSVDDGTIATAVLGGLDDSLRLVIEGVAGGETMVTLRATDPDGGEARVSGQVLVVEPVLFWRDDFDYNTGEWAVDDSNYDRRPGYLSVTFGAVRKDLDNAKDWLVSMSVAAEEGSTNQTVGFWSTSAGSGSKRWLWATLGDVHVYQNIKGAVTPSNWQIVSCCGYAWGAGGMSDAVNAVGEFTEMHWGVRLGTMELFVGETLVWNQGAVEGEWPLVHLASRLFGYNGGGAPGVWMYFDWAELWGIPVEEGEAYLSGEWQLQEGPVLLTPMPLAGVVSQEMDLVAQ